MKAEKYIKVTVTNGFTLALNFPLSEKEKIETVFSEFMDCDMIQLLPVFINEIKGFSYEVKEGFFGRFFYKIMVSILSHVYIHIGKEKYKKACKS